MRASRGGGAWLGEDRLALCTRQIAPRAGSSHSVRASARVAWAAKAMLGDVSPSPLRARGAPWRSAPPSTARRVSGGVRTRRADTDPTGSLRVPTLLGTHRACPSNRGNPAGGWQEGVRPTAGYGLGLARGRRQRSRLGAAPRTRRGSCRWWPSGTTFGPASAHRPAAVAGLHTRRPGEPAGSATRPARPGPSRSSPS
jgi:hypothetical protein